MKHIAGPWIVHNGVTIQRCIACGFALVDSRKHRTPKPFPIGMMLDVKGASIARRYKQIGMVEGDGITLNKIVGLCMDN